MLNSGQGLGQGPTQRIVGLKREMPLRRILVVYHIRYSPLYLTTDPWRVSRVAIRQNWTRAIQLPKLTVSGIGEPIHNETIKKVKLWLRGDLQLGAKEYQRLTRLVEKDASEPEDGHKPHHRSASHRIYVHVHAQNGIVHR